MASETTFRVVIECPATHREVDTGLLMTRDEFAQPTIASSAVECPYCGQRHEYHLADAWLRIDRHVKDTSARNRHPYLRLNKMARRHHQRRRPDPEP